VKELFRHTLVALDQSPASDAILDCLPGMSEFGTRQITLFTAATVSHQNRPSEEEIRRWQGRLDSYAARLLDSAEFQVGTKVDYHGKSPVPQRILEAARKVGAGYIIIANRGHSKIRDVLLGSTVTTLLQQADLPVYLIKLHEEQEATGTDNVPRLRCTASCKDSLEYILYPTDFSDTARIAFDVLQLLAGEMTKRITLFHVQASGQVDMTNAAQLEEFNRIDKERLERLSSEIREQTRVDVDIALGQGPAARLIVEKARLTGATMILMGSQGRGYISDLFLGGVTYHVLRNTPLPVLVIPARRFAGSHHHQSTGNDTCDQ
jgi:nucleotide-binding universal stress UspA family protein